MRAHTLCALNLVWTTLFLTISVLTAPANGQEILHGGRLISNEGPAHTRLGTSIAVDNGIIAIGGAVSVFLVDANTTLPIVTLIPDDGTNSSSFGNSIAIHNGIVAVGAPSDDDNGTNSGSVYLFDASTGNQLFKLLPDDGSPSDAFGNSVAIQSGIVAVGAWGDDDAGGSSGSVYLFDASTGAQISKITPDDGASNDLFGSSVTIDNGILAVGADNDRIKGDPRTGSAYLFDIATGAQLAKLNPSNPDDTSGFSRFGSSIVMSNGIIAVGAPLEDSSVGGGAGAVYLFDLATRTELHRLLASDVSRLAQFGSSLAIENNTLAIGAPGANSALDEFNGATYIFDLATGTQVSKFSPEQLQLHDSYATSTALENGVVITGAPLTDAIGVDSGSVYQYNLSTATQTAQIIPLSSLVDDHLGQSVAIQDRIIAVGASFNDETGSNSGAVYMFSAGLPSFTNHKITPADADPSSQFGHAVAISDGLLAAGAHVDNDNGPASGSAYVFEVDTGNQVSKLLPTDAGLFDFFGISIDIDAQTVAVGAPGGDANASDTGAAYLFDALTGTQLAKLFAGDGQSDDRFGWSIAIDQNIVAVGSYMNDANGQDSGAAYLFDATTGTQLAKLLPSDGAPGDQFGYSIAIDRGIVAVGAWLDQDNGFDSGSVYLFDAATGTQLAKLLPDNGAPSSQFGSSVSIDQHRVAVGATGHNTNGNSTGAAYLFDAVTGTQTHRMVREGTSSENARMGHSISISQGIIITGAIEDDYNGPGAGAAYKFVPCHVDFTGDGQLDFFDFVFFFEHRVDMHGDGMWDFHDIATFLGEFQSGCP